jgi:SRSO17 transposase
MEGQMEQVEKWTVELDVLMNRIGPRFVRSEARQRAKDYVQGLLSPVERKNGWQLAEARGDETPYGIQQFLYRAQWEADEVRDDVYAYVIEQMGDEQAVLIVDETGFLKKGTHSVGVQRQYSGTAGRIENCQIGVFLAYATARGHTLLDRALYLPQEWTADRERCRAAGVPDEIAFTSKPNQAWQMLQRAVEQQVPFMWVTGDSIYGDYRSIRLWLEEVGKGYVLNISAKEYLSLGWYRTRVSDLLAELPSEGWTRLSAGDGTKGPRWYDWYLMALNDPLQSGWKRWMLVRRSLSDPTDLAAYACFAPAATSLATLVQVAGSRWAIEACFEEAKGEVGLDEYEVRTWNGWYRHITLACLAHAFLAVVRAQANAPAAQKGGPWFHVEAADSLAAFKAQRQLSFL